MRSLVFEHVSRAYTRAERARRALGGRRQAAGGRAGACSLSARQSNWIHAREFRNAGNAGMREMRECGNAGEMRNAGNAVDMRVKCGY